VSVLAKLKLTDCPEMPRSESEEDRDLCPLGLGSGSAGVGTQYWAGDIHLVVAADEDARN
jgi:hypothetical protein